MTGSVPPDSSVMPDGTASDRLDSWKEIAAYMRRDVTTVQRWEKREGMPVHRHLHDRLGSVHAFKRELDAWAQQRTPAPATDTPRRQWLIRGFAAAAAVAAAAILILIVLVVWQVRQSGRPPDDPLSGARFQPLTDFDGIEQAAAISRDGRFVAFQSDRDGQMDVWVTQIGTGQFYNLTHGSVPDLSNPSIRTLGFSPDGTQVTFWARRTQGSAQSIGIWAVPVLGGEPRPYLEDAAEFDWSSDGARLVYHTPGPGDPMFVRDRGGPLQPREIFSASAGLHSHFLAWSPDHAYIYFVQGVLPDRMDIWRVRAGGGMPERVTHHDARVSHPVFLGPRILLYLASDQDGSGPWIHSVDTERNVSRRVSIGLDRYTSLAASADGRRIVATIASPKGTLWRAPLTAGPAGPPDTRRVPLTTGSGSSPRLAADYLLYVSSNGSGDSIWKLRNDRASEVWSAPGARIVGRPVISRDGNRVAFSVRQHDETMLYVANADGTDARPITRSLELQGAPAWMPDGRGITIAAVVDGVPRLFNVPIDGGAPAPLVEQYSVDPVWSPDGAFVVFSGPDVGTTFEVNAVSPDGRPYHFPHLTLTRGARHLAVLPGNRLVVLRGELQHKDLWSIDLATGAERQLTVFPSDFNVRDFDVSPDGRDIVLEQVRDHSDIVLVEAPPPEQ